MSHLPIWQLGKINTELCDIAVKELMDILPQGASMGSDGQYVNKEGRDTELRFAAQGYWFSGLMYEFGIQANKVNGWDYKIDDHENMQFGCYRENGHYDWHVDTFPLENRPVERKVSVVCLMNDPSEYTGGEFGIKLYQEYNPVFEKGSIIAFPSMLEHKVYPVLSGTRMTSVIWMTGPQMR